MPIDPALQILGTGTVVSVSVQPTADREGQRRWYAIGFASVLMFFSYTLVVYALAAASNGETTFSGGVLGVAIGLVPVVLFIAAAVSNRERPMRATVLATVVWVVVAGLLAFVDVPTALVAGFGAGGIITLRGSEHAHIANRTIAVGACSLHVLIAQWLLSPAGLMVGSILPFLAIGVADSISEREARVDLDDVINP